MKYLVAGLALFALASPSVHADWRDETERISRTVSAEPGGRLHLRNFSGRVTITATNGHDVVVDATRRAPRERLDAIKLDVHSEGSTIVINANRPDSTWRWLRSNVVETELDVKVPRRMDLDIDVFSSPVTVRGVEGSYRVNGFSSPIRLEEALGPVRAHTFSGPVDIRSKGWRRASGDVIDVNTFSGNITLQVPPDAGGTLTFNSFSGHLDSGIPMTIRKGSRRSLTAEIGAEAGSGGHLRFHTFSGSVRINR